MISYIHLTEFLSLRFLFWKPGVKHALEQFIDFIGVVLNPVALALGRVLVLTDQLLDIKQHGHEQYMA